MMAGRVVWSGPTYSAWIAAGLRCRPKGLVAGRQGSSAVRMQYSPGAPGGGPHVLAVWVVEGSRPWDLVKIAGMQRLELPHLHARRTGLGRDGSVSRRAHTAERLADGAMERAFGLRWCPRYGVGVGAVATADASERQAHRTLAVKSTIGCVPPAVESEQAKNPLLATNKPVPKTLWFLLAQ